MKMSFCPTCGKETGHQRKLGFGTLFAVIITLGWWLLALPFYPKRCLICGDLPSSAAPQSSRPAQELLPEDDQATKKCPLCAEIIKFAALKCRFCGELFNPEQLDQAVAERRQFLQAMAVQGRKQCPHCHQWDVHHATIEGGGHGDWCPHCQMSLQKMATLSR